MRAWIIFITFLLLQDSSVSLWLELTHVKRLPGWYGDKRIPAELSDGIGDILGWRSERTAPSPHLGLAAIPDGHAQEGRSFSVQLCWRSFRAHFPVVLGGCFVKLWMFCKNSWSSHSPSILWRGSAWWHSPKAREEFPVASWRRLWSQAWPGNKLNVFVQQEQKRTVVASAEEAQLTASCYVHPGLGHVLQLTIKISISFLI